MAIAIMHQLHNLCYPVFCNHDAVSAFLSLVYRQEILCLVVPNKSLSGVVTAAELTLR